MCFFLNHLNYTTNVRDLEERRFFLFFVVVFVNFFKIKIKQKKLAKILQLCDVENLLIKTNRRYFYTPKRGKMCFNKKFRN